MKTTILGLAAIAALAICMPVPTMAADPTISPLCQPGAPEAYSRPGGYCSIIASNDSIVPKQSNGAPANYGCGAKAATVTDDGDPNTPETVTCG